MPERIPDGRHDRLGTPGPLIDIVAALCSDPELERIEAKLVAQPTQPFGLGRGSNIAPHAGTIGAQATRGSTEDLAYALALHFSLSVPECRLNSCERPS